MKESELSEDATFWMGEKFCQLQTSQITNIYNMQKIQKPKKKRKWNLEG